MIAFDCPSCGRRLTIPPNLAGRALACPQCRKPLPALAVTSATVAEPPAQTADDRPYPFLAPPQAPDEVGRLAGLRVLRELGSGGMGVVFEAEDVRLKRRVALKVMRPEAAARPEARARFLREAQAVAALSHDHVVTVFQADEQGGTPFLVMPLLKGESLEGRLERQKRLPLAEALRIAREVAEGLAAAHAKGLIHRDVKPGNVWLEEGTNRVKLLDFGLALPTEGGERVTRSGAVLGTPAYMAPEQIDGQADHRADLFSLGCVLYEMLTGRRPFRGGSWVQVLKSVTLEQPPPPHTIAGVLPGASALVMQLLAKDRQHRPPSAAAVARRLRELEAPPAVVVPVAVAKAVPEAPTVTARPAPRRARPRRRSRLVVVLLAVALAAGATAVLLPALRRGRPGPEEEKPAPVADEGDAFTNSVGMKLVRVKPGRFLMGSPESDRDREEQEGPRHEVEITRPFYVGATEVTQGQYRRVTGKSPSHFRAGGPGADRVAGLDTDDFPVENVSWDEAVAFCKALSERPEEKAKGRRYRLPTEAEWEYAARAGTATPFSFGDDPDLVRLGQYAWFFTNAETRTHPAGTLLANPWGLYDVHGNVWEWCSDGPRVYARGPVRDPVGPDGPRRVVRGGSWNCGRMCRSAQRAAYEPDKRFPDTGFRVVATHGDR
jgi:formylglycine-generating enzyme required for sulfatase activity/tRNA A-37 threonylcarbamoyl transferase component Bud32